VQYSSINARVPGETSGGALFDSSAVEGIVCGIRRRKGSHRQDGVSG
jgi:hypothetical protein